MEEKILIEAKNLKKYFKVGANSQLHAVDGVNFKIKRGTTLGVVGESGCGKSTLGRLLLRLYDVTDGQIIYDGTDITKLNAKELKPIRARMQMIFQDPSGSLDPRKSVKELIGEPLKIYKACKTVTNTMPASPRSWRPSAWMSVMQRVSATSWTAAAPAHRHRPRIGHGPGVHHLRRAGLCTGRFHSGTDPESADGSAG